MATFSENQHGRGGKYQCIVVKTHMHGGRDAVRD